MSRQTFWRAVHRMEDDGDIITDGGAGTGKQTILHVAVVQNRPEASFGQIWILDSPWIDAVLLSMSKTPNP